jgi:hypothetical protein
LACEYKFWSRVRTAKQISKPWESFGGKRRKDPKKNRFET